MEQTEENQLNLVAVSASTYIQVTHHHSESISQSEPKEIGFVFTPFPTNQFSPFTTFLNADDIPRCKNCSGFFNRYNVIRDSHYRCSLCGSWSKDELPIAYLSKNDYPEFKYDVYESYIQNKFNVRKNKFFVPTTYFLISLSLFQTHQKEIFSTIENVLSTCFQRRQFGLCILHGSMTLVKFRPFLEFETFCETPEVRSPLYFVSAPYFKQNLQLIQNKLEELAYIDLPDLCKRSIEHGTNMSFQFGTNLYYILDERDYNAFSIPDNFDLIKSFSLMMNQSYVQASVIAFVRNQISSELINPLFYFSTVTGGIFKLFESSNLSQNEITIINDMTKLLNIPCWNETFIFVCPPSNSELSDFAGIGLLKSVTGISVPKIKQGDTFCLKYDSHSSRDVPYCQFVVYYTQDSSSRKMRVFTIPLLHSPIINSQAQNFYVDSFVSRTFLIEGREMAKKILEQLKKVYVNVSCGKSEFIINNMNYIQAALCALSSFNSNYYVIDNTQPPSRVIEHRNEQMNYYNNVL